MDTVRDMVVAIARLEKRMTEVENPAVIYQPEKVPSPPPLRVEFLHVLAGLLVLGLDDMPPPGMPVGVPFSRPAGSEQAKTIELRQFTVGEWSGA